MFQTYLGRKVSDMVTEKIQTPFSVERIKLGYFLRIEMVNVKLLDDYYDTLLRADELSFRLSGIDKENRDIHFSDLNGNNVYFHLIKHPGDSVLNIDHITDRLKDTTQSEPWSIGFMDATLSDTRFRMDDNNKPHTDAGIDFNHMDLSELNARLQNFKVKNDTISAWIQYLSAYEKSGFMLDEFDAHFKISPTGMEGDYVRVQTPNSLLFLDFEFDYYDYKDLGDFVNNVYLNGKLHDCRISTTDMKYFVPQLSGMDNKARISGVFDGRINDLKGRDIILQYGDDTRFFGSLAMKGLPDFKNTFIDANVKTFVTSDSDIQSIELGKHDSLPIPSPLDKLSKIRLEGNFNGTPQIFSSRAMLTTNLGSVSADLVMDKDSTGMPVYEGVISGDTILLGAITNMQEDFGSMNLHAKVKGRGLGEDTDANIDGYVDELGFRGNTYDSIMISGNAGANSFYGDLHIRDENMDLDFSGLADFSSRNPHFDFTSTIRDAYLNRLRISNQSDSLAKLSVVVNADFTGSSIDSLSGMAELRELTYHQDNFIYRMDSLVVTADQHKADEKQLSIHSDFVDGQVKGRFDITSLAKSYSNLMHHYLPAVFAYDSIEIPKPAFAFNLHLKDTRGLSYIFLPSLQITPNSYIEGNYDAKENNLKLETRIDTLYFNNIKFGNLALNTSSYKSHYHTAVRAEEIILKDLKDEKTDALGI